jgi:uncharacterized YccA/Bax inhibitor family protein
MKNNFKKTYIYKNFQPMSFFKSSNPVFSEKVIQHSISTDYVETMTMKGTLNKFGFMLLMLIGSAFYSWKEYTEGGNVLPLILIGLIGGLIVAFTITFKKEWSPYLAPAYGLFEGLFLGAISAFYNEAFATKAPGLIMNAVGLTFGTAVAIYLLFSFKIIKVTEKFRAIVMAATIGIGIFYLITMVVGMFGVNIGYMHEGSIVGIGISLVVVVVAALNLVLNFDMIEQGTAAGAPKYMEWYCAFGLMVTIVWLYLEILRLLSKLSSRD